MSTQPRKRLRDSDISRVRSSQMLAQKLSGWKTAEIAKLFNLTPRHVNREIRSIPVPERRRIAKAYHLGQISVA